MISNQDNIDQWSQYPPPAIAEFGDEGDFDRQHLLNPHIFRLLGNVDGKSILDAGCGNGYLSRKLAKVGAHVTGVEPAKTLYQYAANRETAEPLGITYRQQDLSQYAQPNTFDIVVSNMVFIDIPDWQSAVHNCIHALKSGGQLIFSITHPCFENSSEEYRQNGFLKIKEYFAEYSEQMTYGQNFHRTLSTYFNFVSQEGCTVTGIIEPKLPDTIAEQFPTHRRTNHIPNFLIMNSYKNARQL